MNPAKVQEFYIFSAEKVSSAHKSCIIAGFMSNGNKTERKWCIFASFLAWQRVWASLLGVTCSPNEHNKKQFMLIDGICLANRKMNNKNKVNELKADIPARLLSFW